MYQQTLSDYLGISSDISISFLDGVITSSVVKDRTVYLYPDYLSRNIEGFDSIEARSTIVSFFSKVTDIANDSNISEYEKSNKLGKLFDHVQEISSLSLGQAKDNNKGNGPKYKALLDFAYIVSNFSEKSLIEEEGMYVKSAELLVDNFGPDSLSDLIASLIYPQLIGYTKFVFDKYNISYEGIDVKPVNGKQRFVWDKKIESWKIYSENTIAVNDVEITLVPYKLLTSSKKIIDPVNCIRNFLYPYLIDNDPSLKKLVDAIGGKNKFLKKSGNLSKKFIRSYVNNTSDLNRIEIIDILRQYLYSERGVNKSLTGPEDTIKAS